MNRIGVKYHSLLLIGAWLFFAPLSSIYATASDSLVLSKSDIKPILLYTNNTVMFGAGSTNIYDTYLSPLEYKGYNIRLFNEKMRRTTWFDYKFYKQQFIELEFSNTDNPANNASKYRLALNYRLGGHYEIYKLDRLRLGVGGLWTTNAGVLFNNRNGNNPATAQVYTNLELSVLASYAFNKWAVRWQLDSPMAGMLFSPKFGQSFYEMSLGNSVGVVNFASLHNQRALRNYLTVDVAIGNYIVRTGYLGVYYQTRVNKIQTHNYIHSFVLGFPIEGKMKARKKATNVYWK